MGIYIGWRSNRKKRTPKVSRKKGMTIEWVDRPAREPAVWQVFADDHDGQGFRPVGEHRGDPGDFNPWR